MSAVLLAQRNQGIAEEYQGHYGMLVLLHTYQMWLKVGVNEDVTAQYLVTGVVRIYLE